VLRLRPVVGKFRTPSRADADSENEKISRRQVTASRYYHRTLGVQVCPSCRRSALQHYEAKLYRSISDQRKRMLCTVYLVAPWGWLLIVTAAKLIDAFDFPLARYGDLVAEWELPAPARARMRAPNLRFLVFRQLAQF